MSNNHHCQARQYSDQMICGKCGLAWDVNDPEPPECHSKVSSSTQTLRDGFVKGIQQLRDQIAKASK